MVNKSVTYSLPVLRKLVSSETSCVYCHEQCRRCFYTNPLQLVNVKNAVQEHLKSKITTYDTELHGIILSHKNVKVINSVQLNDDGEFSLEYIADIYIFKPHVGSILTGRVNKKSQDHLGALVHSVCNATIPRPRNEDECPKMWVSHIKIGDQITFEVMKVNFLGRLPYIEGKLLELEERDTEDGDSGIGGHESTEEGTFNKISPVSDSFVTNNINYEKKSYKAEKISVLNSPQCSSPVTSRKRSSMLDLQSTLLNEALGRSISNSEGRADIETNVLDDVSSSRKSKKEKSSSKKRKSSSSLLELENSLIKSDAENFNSPELSDKCVPKKKKSNVDDLSKSFEKESFESIINNLMSSEISSLTPAKKKLSIGISDVNLSQKKHKKKKSKEAPLIERPEELVNNETVCAPKEQKKIKKKWSTLNLNDSMSHLHSLSEIDFTDGQSQNIDNGGEQSDPYSHVKKKKKKSHSFKESENSLINITNDNVTDELNCNIQNIDNQDLCNLPKKHKKKKKESLSMDVGNLSNWDKSHSFKESENSLINITNDNVTDELNCNIQNIDNQDLCNLPKKHKKKKKEFLSMDVSNLSNWNMESPNEINQLSCDGQIDTPDHKEYRKKKKKKSSVTLSDATHPQTVINSENTLDTSSTNVTTEVKSKKKKKSSVTLNDTPHSEVGINSEGLSENTLDSNSTSVTTEVISKKKKKSSVTLIDTSYPQLVINSEGFSENTLNTSSTSVTQDLKFKKKKKKKSYYPEMETYT